ncbi:rhomboid family intramembrane serine protease [Candidatus Neomarinimicrobiota bacterium]
MFFPYKDDNPRLLIPYVTYTILAVNILVYLYQLSINDPWLAHLFSLRFGLIPSHFWGASATDILDFNRRLIAEISGGLSIVASSVPQLLPAPITMFTSPFLHGSLGHLLGNMLFLYVFADNVEGALGYKRFTLFYFGAALAAGLSQLFASPTGMLPVIGASGAISGVLGGYMVRYPRARVHVLVFIVIFITTIRLPAAVVLGLWFMFQLLNGLISYQSELHGGIAWFEHIGGFAFGFLFMSILGRSRKFVRRYG